MINVTILGSGNGGVACAYHLARNGNNVIMYDFPEFDNQIKAINEQGGVRAVEAEHGETMQIPGFERNVRGTHDIKEAVEFSDVYIIVCPSFAQERFFAQMIPYLRDGSLVITFTANYASLVFTKMLKESGRENLDITFADTNTLPWACRLSEIPGAVCISGVKKFIPVAVYPKSKDADSRITVLLENVMPIPVSKLGNVLAAGLENINIGGHPLYCTVNMGLLETFEGNFNYYRDCCSPATSRAQDKLEAERIAVGAGYGLNLMSDIDMVNALYGYNEKNSYEFNKHSEAHGKLGGAPSSSKHRYITEDIPYSMVPMYELGKLVGIRTPVCEACIVLGSAYNDEDYFATGRTLEKMGLSGLSKEEIIKMISK